MHHIVVHFTKNIITSLNMKFNHLFLVLAYIDPTNGIGNFPRKHKSRMKKEVVPVERKKKKMGTVSDVTVKIWQLKSVTKLLYLQKWIINGVTVK